MGRYRVAYPSALDIVFKTIVLDLTLPAVMRLHRIARHLAQLAPAEACRWIDLVAPEVDAVGASDGIGHTRTTMPQLRHQQPHCFVCV